MSEHEKTAAERFANALNEIPKDKQEGLLRYAEGYADCAADLKDLIRKTADDPDKEGEN